MIMQRILIYGTLRRAAVVRPLLMGVTVHEPPVAFCCFALRLSPPTHTPTGQRWLSSSASSKAAHQPKHQPPEDEPQSSSAPPSQPLQKEEAGPGPSPGPVEVDPLQDKSIGLVQRFKRTFKQYGKVLIPVHLLTSSIWFGTFYYAAMKGVNVVPFLEMIGLPESLVSLLRDSSSGYALTAYAMYKIATPARYTATLGGTSLSVQYLRKHGYLSTPPPVTEYFQDKMEETKEKLSEKMEETKERLSEKMEETKGRFSEKMEETKDKFSEKLQETKDRVSEGKAFFRKKND
ncbi:uncharacterized protein C18orf19 homolog A-like [Scomber japonicus]|uniref:uncharacterized protein C18orf19 homolog A-like n=1 Tax=Scomber japonicus TaxID=13676 RepID=UPI0023053F95|nr:uncharacterized protein C18orf19 homolog A-like [Scomber japonicus]XP_053183438.1 uncharacterized protein C18orf19 homolog A-like [Scomber japonicus]